MTARTWIGGGNNQASNPHDWSPAGTPEPGDQLTIDGGTMRVHDFVLASPGIGSLIVEGDSTIDLSNAIVGSTITVETVPFLTTDATFNVRGHFDAFNLDILGGLGETTQQVAVNLAPHAHWIGGITTDNHFGNGGVTVHGAPGSVFDNTSSIINYTEGSSVLDVAVGGTGTFSVSDDATLEFGRAVGPGQTVDVEQQQTYGIIQIDRPTGFHGLVQLDGGIVNLEGLIKAESYQFKNDLLSIYNGHKVIDTLRLDASAPFDIEKTTTGVALYTDGIANPDPTGTPLPLHT